MFSKDKAVPCVILVIISNGRHVSGMPQERLPKQALRK